MGLLTDHVFRGGDIWICLRPTWGYLNIDLNERDWDQYRSHNRLWLYLRSKLLFPRHACDIRPWIIMAVLIPEPAILLVSGEIATSRVALGTRMTKSRIRERCVNLTVLSPYFRLLINRKYGDKQSNCVFVYLKVFRHCIVKGEKEKSSWFCGQCKLSVYWPVAVITVMLVFSVVILSAAFAENTNCFLKFLLFL